MEYTSDEGYTNVPDKDITIVAKYRINVHKVTYFVDDVKVHEQEYNYHATIAEYSYTKEGYTISAWVGLPVDMLMPDEDLEIRATSTVNEYNVTFNVDGTAYETKKVAYGTAITVPTVAPTKTGYTFKQWIDVPKTMPAQDIVIEAEFTINSYSLTFKNGTDVVTAFTVEYGAALAVYPSQAMALVPVKDGFTFSWDSAVPATMPAEDVVVEGSYKEKKELLYHGMIKEQDFGTLTEDMVSAYASSAPSENITFTILPNEEYQKQFAISENANTDEEAAEAEAWMREFEKNNTYSFVIAIPSKYAKVRFLYVDMDESEIFDFQKETNTMNLNGEEYALWVAHHEMLEKDNVYAPRTEEYSETYKLIF